jgi:hypothetical protein
MLQWLRGELPSVDGNRVYLTRAVPEPAANDGLKGHDAWRGVERGFMHPGKWRVYADYGVEDYPSAEAILEAGWTVD